MYCGPQRRIIEHQVRALQARAHSSRQPIAGRSKGLAIAPRLTVKDAAGRLIAEEEWPKGGLDHRQATRRFSSASTELLDGTPVSAVGHRVVHGGTDFSAPTRVDEQVMSASCGSCVPSRRSISRITSRAIDALTELAPHIPQVACFDTAFHRNQPELAQIFAIPRELTEGGRQALRFPRPFVRIYRQATDREGAGYSEGASAGCPSRQWRKPLCAAQRAAALRQRWVSPRSTD